MNSIAYLSLVILCTQFKQYVTSRNVLEGRIVDGEDVKIRKYPHAVFLEVIKCDESTYVCGSSVVNQHFLLTAAHCFSENGREIDDKIVAYAGHENLKKTNIVRKTRLPILHEDYDSEEVQNDIALVYLHRPLPLGKSVMRIIITKSFPLSTKGSIAGWGIINDVTNEETILLKAIKQTVKSKKACSLVTTGPGTLCAGSMRSSDPRPAEGDSGSGLIAPNHQIIGLLSYKLTNLPALPVYTNVSFYYNWIHNHIKKRCIKY